MDERSWWLALGGVMLLALVVTLVDGWGRSGRRPRGAGRPDGSGGVRPLPGEIWWTRESSARGDSWAPGDRDAHGPEDPAGPEDPGAPEWQHGPERTGDETGAGDDTGAAGARDRDDRGHEAPCVVLSVRGEQVRVVRITGRRDEARSGVIALPPGAVPGAGGRAGFVETDEPRAVSLRRFRRRAGVVDPMLWDQIRHLTRDAGGS